MKKLLQEKIRRILADSPKLVFISESSEGREPYLKGDDDEFVRALGLKSESGEGVEFWAFIRDYDWFTIQVKAGVLELPSWVPEGSELVELGYEHD